MITLQDIKERIDSVFEEHEMRLTADGIMAENRVYHLKIEIEDVWFNVDIEAYDDPLDSENEITDDPAKALAKFFSSEVPGGEFFDRMSFAPQDMSRRLKFVASRIGSGKVSAANAARQIKRLIACCGHDVTELGKIASHLLRLRIANSELRTVDRRIFEILARLRELGWDALESKTKTGAPAVKVNIGDRYEATISVNNINYVCEFYVIGFPETKVRLETDDPLQKLMEWANRPNVVEAINVRRKAIGTEEFQMPADDATTVPAPAPDIK